MSKIETIYRTRIDYIWTDDGEDHAQDYTDKVENKAFQFTLKEKDVELTTFQGCPVCGPYIELESGCRGSVERVAGKIERYIKRFKGIELEP